MFFPQMVNRTLRIENVIALLTSKMSLASSSLLPSAATIPSTTSSKPPNPSNLTRIHSPTNSNPLVRRFPAAPYPSNSPTPSSPPYQICLRATHCTMSLRSYSRHGGAPNACKSRIKPKKLEKFKPKKIKEI